ncbi:hypothetical protein NQ315_010795 [Exocentrus adspersus]|uniref:Uncharacterized protein n=1 Tax=Exocentrus adspersus TaxID=1586481 RepID=A0AAV8VU05_9CUCU|nr:hypothetical protein NQ315_010795 [Exocentrus adspersus]
MYNIKDDGFVSWMLNRIVSEVSEYVVSVSVSATLQPTTVTSGNNRRDRRDLFMKQKSTIPKSFK